MDSRPAESQIDWHGIKAASLTVGVREAARRASANLTSQEQIRFVNRVLKRSEREGWIKKAKEERAKPLTLSQSKPLSANVITGSDVIINALKDDADETKLSLSRSLRRGSKAVEQLPAIAVFTGADKVKHLIGAASQLHGWEQAKQSSNLDLRILAGGRAMIQVNQNSVEKP